MKTAGRPPTPREQLASRTPGLRRFSIDLDDDTIDGLDEIAKAEERTRVAQIRLALREYVAEHRKKKR
jgi:metal-responsive CopG/Arc/MetJ family transcriptional regulator